MFRMIENGQGGEFIYTGSTHRKMGSAQFDVELEIMKAAGLGDEQIARLAIVRNEVDFGRRSELTIESKRLIFSKYLCEAGKIWG